MVDSDDPNYLFKQDDDDRKYQMQISCPIDRDDMDLNGLDINSVSSEDCQLMGKMSMVMMFIVVKLVWNKCGISSKFDLIVKKKHVDY